MPTLTEVLKALYASEINVEISCFWDSGWAVRLGDEMNGFKAQDTIDTIDDVPRWLIQQAKAFYPNSQFAARF